MKAPADRPNPCRHEPDETQETTESKEQQEAQSDHGIPDLHVAHGIDLATGDPIAPPKTWAEMRECVLATYQGRQTELLRRAQTMQAADEDRPHRGQPPAEVDPDDLASAGWGVVFATDLDPAVREALQPLLDHRKEQAGDRFKVFDETKRLAPGQSVDDWLRAFHLPPHGPTDPDRVPYYLLVVGDPASVPFDRDFDFGSKFATGRLFFEDPADYARYAESVVSAECAPHDARRCAFFATDHPGDCATWGSRRKLVQPLLERHAGAESTVEGWTFDQALDENATVPRLKELFAERPSLLFTVGHGLGAGPEGDLHDRVGALLCAEWPGAGSGPLEPAHYFAASDLEASFDLRGMVSILFGCYTAGLPAEDSFCSVPPRRLTDHPQVAALASAMLGRENGALAVLGHVDRAWSYSYRWRGMQQPETFSSVLTDLLAGRRLGYAARHLGDRYLQLTQRAATVFRALARGRSVKPSDLVEVEVAERDARSYLVVGDPAVRPGG